MIISIAQAGTGIINTYRKWLTPLFEQIGWTSKPLPLSGSVHDLGDLLFSINYLPQLAKIAKDYHIPYCCWIIDPLVNRALLNTELASNFTIMLHFSKQDKNRFEEIGFDNCHYLPLSIQPFKQQKPETKDLDISFVGNCYKPSTCQYIAYKKAYQASGISPAMGLSTLEAYIKLVLEDWTLPLHTTFLEFIKKQHPGFMQQVPVHNQNVRNYSPQDIASYFIDLLLYHEIDRRLRERIINAFIPNGIHLWGDDGWLPLEKKGALYHGFTTGEAELSRILFRSKICLNIQRRLTDGLNMRNFEATAHGALLLTQANNQLNEAFLPDKECITYTAPEEGVEKAAYYLEHDSAATKIREAGQLRFQKEHQLENRIKQIHQILKQQGII